MVVDGAINGDVFVAYVEQVVSDTEIIVSEDYWGGDFYWRRLSNGDVGIVMILHERMHQIDRLRDDFK